MIIPELSNTPSNQTLQSSVEKKKVEKKCDYKEQTRKN